MINKEEKILEEMQILFENKKYKEVKQYFSKNKSYLRNYVEIIAMNCLCENNKYLNILKELKNLRSMSFTQKNFYIDYNKEFKLIKNCTKEELDYYSELKEEKSILIEIVFDLNIQDKKDVILSNYVNKVELHKYILENDLESYFYLTENILSANNVSNYLITDIFIEHLKINRKNEKLKELFKKINIFDIKYINQMKNLFLDKNLNLINTDLLLLHGDNIELYCSLFNRMFKKDTYIEEEKLSRRIEELKDLLNSKIILKNF